MPESLSERDLRSIWHPYTQAKIAPKPIAISRAQGSYLYTEEGEKLFDGISSWWTCAHGHAHPDIAHALAKQAYHLQHVIFANFTHEPAVKLAEELLQIVPPNLSRVFYCDSGSAAVEVALKMAYQYWLHRKSPRSLFLSLECGYHGDTFGAMSVSERSAYTKPFWPLLFKVLMTPTACVSEVGEKSEEEITNNALTKLRRLLEQHPNQIAGIILEPMLQVAGGLKIFTAGFLAGIKKLCVEYDILLIADEIATGFYRTGKFFACEHEQVAPDIMCLAKGLTGGFLPMSVTLAREEIYEAFLTDQKADALLHGHSFSGSPLGCAAALESIALFKKAETKNAIADIVNAVSYGIMQFRDLKKVKNARHMGTIAVIELNSEHAGYLSHEADIVSHYCLKKGLFIRPLGNVIYLMPPLCTTKEEIHWALSVIRDAITIER